MRRLNPAPRADQITGPQANQWLQAVTERLGVYHSEALPALSELPNNQWVLHRNTVSGEVNFVFNDEGVLRKVLLTTDPVSADDVIVLPAGDIASTNVQAALEELDSEKLKSVAVASANGFGGSTATPGTPTITLTTSITGLLKGNGAAISAAAAGTDYVVPSGNIGAATGTSLAVTGALSSSGGGIGYTTGAGGTVVQTTDKSTGVTLDKLCGTITMDGAALAANTVVSFTLTNSFIAVGDYVMVQHVSAGTLGSYNCSAIAAAGSATISVRNNQSVASLGEAIVLQFAVIKAVTA
jgi:hypothetical protein